MPLVSARLASDINIRLVANGNVGVNTMNFATAVATGVTLTFLGATFTTTDSGQGNLVGVGVGTGLTGISSGSMEQNLLVSYLSIFNRVGPTFEHMASAIAGAVVTELKLVSLASNHQPCWSGTGIIDPGSISVTEDELASNIEKSGPLFFGDDWPDTALAIARGISLEVVKASGKLTITGSPPPVPPGPVPFNGPNTIVPAGVIS